MGLFSSSTPTAPPPAEDAGLAVQQRLLDIAEGELAESEAALQAVRATASRTDGDDHSLAVRELSLIRTVSRKNAHVVALRQQAVEANNQGGNQNVKYNADGSMEPVSGDGFRFGPARSVNPLAGTGMQFGPQPGTVLRQKMKTVMEDRGTHYLMVEVPDNG